MRAFLAVVVAMAVALAPSTWVSAQEHVALWTTSSVDVGDLAERVAAAARDALGTRRAAPAAASCDPTDTGCVRRLLHGTGASRLVTVRTIWVRGPCVPIVRDGVRVGSRMLRAPGVELTLYAADGAVLGERTLRNDDHDVLVAQVGPAIEELLAP